MLEKLKVFVPDDNLFSKKQF